MRATKRNKTKIPSWTPQKHESKDDHYFTGNNQAFGMGTKRW
jgi:hypothetical protein